MKIDNLEQGSPEWLVLRRTKITGSDASSILGLNPYKSRDQLMECKKTGHEEPVNQAMKRGTELEPIARAMYENSVGYKMSPTVHVGREDLGFDEECAFLLTPKLFTVDSWAMCSTDGLSEDGTILLEIKCGKTAFKQAKQGFIPDYYLAQMQWCLWLTGAKECHYAAFDGKDELIVMKVAKNDEFINEMVPKAYQFWKEMSDGL